LKGETQRLLNGYIDYLKRARPGQHEPGVDVNVDRAQINLIEDDASHSDPQSLIPDPYDH